MDGELDETLTARQNAERRTLWTREQVYGMLALQRRDDAALVRERARQYGDGSTGMCARAVHNAADLIDPPPIEKEHLEPVEPSVTDVRDLECVARLGPIVRIRSGHDEVFHWHSERYGHTSPDLPLIYREH